MSWHPEIDEMRRREEMARGRGEPDRIKRQLGRKRTIAAHGTPAHRTPDEAGLLPRARRQRRHPDAAVKRGSR